MLFAHRNWERFALKVCSVEDWLGAMKYRPSRDGFDQQSFVPPAVWWARAGRDDDGSRDCQRVQKL